MDKAIILLNKQFKPEQIEQIKKIASSYQIKTIDDINESEFNQVEIMYAWNHAYTSEDLSKFTRLKWLQAASAGVDYLPKEINEKTDLQITNMSGVHAVPITESVFGYLLGTGRQLFTSQINQANSQWIRPAHESYFSLKEKTLLVYGTGNIGQEMAQIGQAFGMRTIGINTNGRSIAHFDETFSMADSLQAVEKADFIISTLPATDQTFHYFNSDWFKHLKQSALFVNIGRGQTVDEEAIVTALTNDQFAGAYLDVFHTEPLPETSALWQTKNLLITPHITGHIAHFAKETYPIFKENLESFVKSGTLSRNLVSKDKGY